MIADRRGGRAGLFEELKRRRVIRVVLVYVVAGWAVVQVSATTFPMLDLPAWAPRLVLVLVLLGLPLAIGLAWAFDLTPTGVQRTPPHRQRRGARLPDAAPAEAVDPAKRRFGAIAVIGAVAILATAGIASVLLRAGGRLPAERILVVPFENQTGDASLDAVGRMAADWVTQGLLRAGIGEPVPSVDALQTLHVLRGARGGAALPPAVLAAETGAGTIVQGTIYLRGDSLEFQAQVFDAARGQLVDAIPAVRGGVDDPGVALESVRQRVLGVLAAHLDPRAFRTAAGALPFSPPSYDSYRAYDEAMSLFVRREWRAAAARFGEAAALDTTFALALGYQAVALLNSVNLAAADSLHGELSRRRDRLSPLERNNVDWLGANLAGDIARQLRYAVEGASLSAGDGLLYQVGLDASRSNRPRQALAALRQIDPERGWMREWAAYWAVLGASHHMLGQHRRELRAAQRGRQQFPELLSVLNNELIAAAARGRAREIERLLDEAPLLPPQNGWSIGGLMRGAALELRAHGHAAAGDELLARAVAWYDALPPAQLAPIIRGHLQTLHAAGRWTEAQSLADSLAADAPNDMALTGHRGVIAAALGDRDRALAADAWLRDLERPYLFGANTYWRARIAARLGDRDRAVALLRQAFTEGSGFGLNLHREPDLESLHDFASFRDFLRPRE